MIQEKIKKIIKRSDKEKQKNIAHFENIVGDNKKLKDKLREIEDWSHRDNLSFDGVREYENESWNDMEEVLKEYFLFEILSLQNIKIERAHRTRKLSSYETKEMILKMPGNQRIPFTM